MTSKISQARPCRPEGLEANIDRENPQAGEAAVKGARTSVRFTSGTRSASAKPSAAGPRPELKRNKFRAPKNRRGLRRFGQGWMLFRNSMRPCRKHFVQSPGAGSREIRRDDRAGDFDRRWKVPAREWASRPVAHPVPRRPGPPDWRCASHNETRRPTQDGRANPAMNAGRTDDSDHLTRCCHAMYPCCPAWDGYEFATPCSPRGAATNPSPGSPPSTPLRRTHLPVRWRSRREMRSSNLD